MEGEGGRGKRQERERENVNEQERDLIRSAFLDPASPVAYTSLQRVYEKCKSLIHGLTKGTVAHVLSAEPEYTQHRNFKAVDGRKTIYRSPIPFHEVAIDLMEVGSIKNSNSGIRFLFIFQGILSKYLIVVPIKSKTTESIRSGFDKFYSHPLINGKKGIIYWSDREAGIRANESYLHHKYDASVWYSNSLNKAKSVFAENQIRYLSSRLYRYLSYVGKTKYLSNLQNIVDGMNNSTKKSLYGQSPASVVKDATAMKKLLKQKIKEELLREKKNTGKMPYLRIGDLVLTKHWPPSLFRKNFLPKFQSQPRLVTGIKLSIPYMYSVQGLPFKFYRGQLSLVKRGSQIFQEKLNKQKPQTHSRRQYKLIRTKLDPDRQTRNGKILSYVKSYEIKDLQDNSTEWLNEKEYQNLKDKEQIVQSKDE